MRELTVSEVKAEALAAMELAPIRELSSREGLAALVLRAAALAQPASQPAIKRAVVEALRGLTEDPKTTTIEEVLDDTVEELLAHGDLLEVRRESPDELVARSKLFAAPPSYVRVGPAHFVVLGSASDGGLPLPPLLQSSMQRTGSVRHLAINGDEAAAASQLRDVGFIEIPLNHWLVAPAVSKAAEVAAAYEAKLTHSPRAGEISDLELLDSARPVSYYRGRWIGVRRQSGAFVARREQRYSAARWCYVRLLEGEPAQLLDLPTLGERWRGCDEAWWLQAAIDSHRGTPQEFVLERSGDGTATMRLFSPVPAWVRRHLDVLGNVTDAKGCLIAYELKNDRADTAQRLLKERLWLVERSA